MYNARYEVYASSTPTLSTTSYLRRVYSLFSGGIAFVIAGAMIALYSGTPVRVARGLDEVLVPPVVAFGLEHPWLSLIGFMGAFFAASSVRFRPGLNVAALFGFTFVTGLFAAPTLFIATLLSSQGYGLTASPVRDAFLLTGAAFAGLTGYAFVSKRDFSFLGAALSTGIWVILGASLLSIFFHSTVFSLAIASVGVLLFAGYILYDTSRILRDRDSIDPVGAALMLFLDVFNMFMYLVQILASGSRRD